MGPPLTVGVCRASSLCGLRRRVSRISSSRRYLCGICECPCRVSGRVNVDFVYDRVSARPVRCERALIGDVGTRKIAKAQDGIQGVGLYGGPYYTKCVACSCSISVGRMTKKRMNSHGADGADHFDRCDTRPDLVPRLRESSLLFSNNETPTCIYYSLTECELEPNPHYPQPKH